MVLKWFSSVMVGIAAVQTRLAENLRSDRYDTKLTKSDRDGGQAYRL